MNKTLNLGCASILIVCCFLTFAANAQNMGAINEHEFSMDSLDPLYFISVYEHRRSDMYPQLIWERGQRHYKGYVDRKSEIVVTFDKNELIERTRFDGNFALEARIDGKPVEIPHYAELGQSYSKIGVGSSSPYEFSLSFLTAIYNVYELVRDKNFQNEYQKTLASYDKMDSRGLTEESEWFDKKKSSIAKYLKQRVDEAEALNKSTQAKDTISLEEANNIVNKIDTAFLKKLGVLGLFQLILTNQTSVSIETIEEMIFKNSSMKNTEDSSNFNKLEKIMVDEVSRTYPNEKTYFNKKDFAFIGEDNFESFLYSIDLGGIFELLKNDPTRIELADLRSLIDSAGNPTDTRYALNIISNEYLYRLNFAIENLSKISEYVSKFNRADITTRRALTNVIGKDTLFLIQSERYMQKGLDLLKSTLDGFSQLRNELSIHTGVGTFWTEPRKFRLASLHSQYLEGMRMFFVIMKQVRDLEQREFEKAKEGLGEEFANEPKSLDKWAEFVAKNAAKELYKKLDPAKLDLSLLNGIAEGSKLELYVLIYDNSDKPTRKLVSTFIITEMGWRFSVTESLLLINRINESYASSTDLSPSNFKPSGGASMMWTFNRYISKRNGSSLSYKGNDFLTTLRPSVGFNVSYVDFRDNQFEVGCGPVVGLFDNRLFFTAGYNLNVKGVSPFYFGIGFSFSNVLNSIKNERSDF